MKIYVYKDQIISLENFVKICAISNETLEIRYINSDRQILHFNSSKDLHEGLEKIIVILRGTSENTSK